MLIVRWGSVSYLLKYKNVRICFLFNSKEYFSYKENIVFLFFITKEIIRVYHGFIYVTITFSLGRRFDLYISLFIKIIIHLVGTLKIF